VLAATDEVTSVIRGQARIDVMEEDLERSRQAGFLTHLIKPVDYNQLRRALAMFENGHE
jgi:response regulator of citrate/malate metabolism